MGYGASVSIGAYALNGGVGDRRDSLCFWLRCLDFRESIEPAQDLTFFCFLLAFLDTEDLREGVRSKDGRAASIVLFSAG